MLNLYRSLKNIVKIDSHPWFYDTFTIYYQANLFKKFLVQFYIRSPNFNWLRVFIQFSFGFFSTLFFKVSIKDSHICVTEVTKNEINAIKEHLDINQVSQYSSIKKSYLPSLSINFLITVLSKGPQIISILSMTYKYNELVQLRSSQNLFLYIKYYTLFKGKNYDFITSTQSSPYALALEAICNQFNLGITLVDHGFYLNSLPYTKFTKVYFNSKFNKQLFDSGQGRYQSFEVKSHNIKPIQLPKSPKFGIFLPKIYRKSFLTKNNLNDYLIRSHPLNLISKLFTPKKPLNEDLNQVDIGISGSSSILVDILLAGKAAVYVEEIDVTQQEGYEFVKLGLVPSFKSLKDISTDQIEKFYSSDEYHNLLTKFFL